MAQSIRSSPAIFLLHLPEAHTTVLFPPEKYAQMVVEQLIHRQMSPPLFL